MWMCRLVSAFVVHMQQVRFSHIQAQLFDFNSLFSGKDCSTEWFSSYWHVALQCGCTECCWINLEPCFRRSSNITVWNQVQHSNNWYHSNTTGCILPKGKYMRKQQEQTLTLKDISYLELWQPLCLVEWNHFCNLVEAIMMNNSVK